MHEKIDYQLCERVQTSDGFTPEVPQKFLPLLDPTGSSALSPVHRHRQFSDPHLVMHNFCHCCCRRPI